MDKLAKFCSNSWLLVDLLLEYGTLLKFVSEILC